MGYHQWRISYHQPSQARPCIERTKPLLQLQMAADSASPSTSLIYSQHFSRPRLIYSQHLWRVILGRILNYSQHF